MVCEVTDDVMVDGSFSFPVLIATIISPPLFIGSGAKLEVQEQFLSTNKNIKLAFFDYCKDTVTLF